MEKLNKNNENDNELLKFTIEDWVGIKDKIIKNELIGRYLQPFDVKIFNKKEVVVFLLNFMGLCISEKNLDSEINKDTVNFLASGLRLSHELLSILNRGYRKILESYGEISSLYFYIENNLSNNDKIKLYYTLKLLISVLNIIYYKKQNPRTPVLRDLYHKVSMLIIRLYIPNGKNMILNIEKVKEYFNNCYLKYRRSDK